MTMPSADTSLTKVFVGGLAWETPKEVLREHYEKYGEILEAVIISDKITGRSKGYGFVTFKEPEDAKSACENTSPVINGRKANCNLASLGARRAKSANAIPIQVNSPPAATLYYPTAASFHHPIMSYYGHYSQVNYNGYNHKMNYASNTPSYYSQLYPMVGGGAFVPMYPFYPPPAAHFYPHGVVSKGGNVVASRAAKSYCQNNCKAYKIH